MSKTSNQSGSTPSADKFSGKAVTASTTKAFKKDSGEKTKPVKNGAK